MRAGLAATMAVAVTAWGALMQPTLPARAQPPAASGASGPAIRQVIQAQIAAFRRNDGEAALAFAAPALREKFGGGARFLAMVRRAYAPIFRPKSVTFGSLEDAGTHEQQRVDFIGEDGQVATALYDMEHEPDGSWRIAGCSLLASPSIAI